MGSLSTRWRPAAGLAVAALAFGAGQLLFFPTSSDPGVQMLTEGAVVPLLVGGLFLIATLDPDRRVGELLYAGTFVLLLHGVTETVDEVSTPPLVFTVVFEHFGLLVGVGLLFGATRRWARLRGERQRDLEHVRGLLERTEHLAQVGGWELDATTDELNWTDGTRRIHDLPADYDPTLDEALSFYRDDDRTHLTDLLTACREDGSPFQTELRLVTADDRVRWVQVSGEAVTDGDSVVSVRGAIQDITDQKEREQQLDVYNRILRHNLRNDLNVIMAWAELITDLLPEPDTPEGESQWNGDTEIGIEYRAVERIRHRARSLVSKSQELVSLADKIRRYHQLTVEAESVEPTELEPLLERVRDEQRSAHPEATIRLSCPSDVSVLSTPVFLRAALGELVDNAITHAETSAPTVDIIAAQSEGERVEIRVHDRGPGIPENELAFLDGEESALEHGSGFGLWFATWLVARQEGTISVDDDGGTVVTIRLPAVTDTDTAAPRAAGGV